MLHQLIMEKYCVPPKEISYFELWLTRSISLRSKGTLDKTKFSKVEKDQRYDIAKE